MLDLRIRVSTLAPMHTCKTCKWHAPEPGDTPEERANWGRCMCPKLYEHGCGPEGDWTRARDHLAYSSSPVPTALYTGMDFGCVHWTKRQK